MASTKKRLGTAAATRTTMPAGGSNTAAATVACKTTPTPADPICSFRAQAGQLTLKVTGKQGIIEFQTAQYNGTPIAGTPSDTIAFTVATGQRNLDVVFAFSDTVGGRGELHEVCKDNVLLDPDVNTTSPAVRYVICV